MTAATTRDACDVCAGRATIDDVRNPGVVTCSTHFIDAMFPEDKPKRRSSTTCPECGWPFRRIVITCANTAQHGKEEA